LGYGVIWVAVRMVLQSQLVIAFFQFFLARIGRYAEDFVIIPFDHASYLSGASVPNLVAGDSTYDFP
jgi:hypothetical protein